MGDSLILDHADDSPYYEHMIGATAEEEHKGGGSAGRGNNGTDTHLLR